PRDPVALGVFLHEMGRPYLEQVQGNIEASAIYFREPTRTTPGELLFARSRQGSGIVTLSSENFFERIKDLVEVEVSPGGVAAEAGEAARVVQIRLVFRRYTDE